jgi:hypothetical protein
MAPSPLRGPGIDAVRISPLPGACPLPQEMAAAAQGAGQLTLPVLGGVVGLELGRLTGQKKLGSISGPCSVLLFVSCSRRPQRCVAAVPATVDATRRVSVAWGAYTAAFWAALLGVEEAEVGSVLELRMTPAADAEQQLPVLQAINGDPAAQQAACRRPRLLVGHLLVRVGDGSREEGAAPLCSSSSGDGGDGTMTFTLPPPLPQVRCAGGPAALPAYRPAPCPACLRCGRVPTSCAH